MKFNAGLIIKIAVGLAGIAIGFAEKALANKDLDAKVAKQVAEAIQSKVGES